MGLIYLLHFERSYHHARHYLGYTDDLDARRRRAPRRARQSAGGRGRARRDRVPRRRDVARGPHRGASAAPLPQLAAAAVPDLPRHPGPRRPGGAGGRICVVGRR